MTDEKNPYANLSPPNPYLIRALFEWILANNLTPYVVIMVQEQGVRVPEDYMGMREIVLNIGPRASCNLHISNEALECDVQFSGVTHHIYAPIFAITSIYAKENNVGMVFSSEECKKHMLSGMTPATQKPSLFVMKGKEEKEGRSSISSAKTTATAKSKMTANKPKFTVIKGGKDKEKK
jgi:stringent starvation protein B